MDETPTFPHDFQLVVVSQSPRRHSLLRDLGIPFTVATSAARELLSGAPVTVLAETNALAKIQRARLSDSVKRGAFVLGTDTLVSVGRRIMGKPSSAQEAAEMLATLSARTHRVVSGVAVGRTGGARAGVGLEQVRVASAVTMVTFAALDRSQIAAYVAAGEWADKAGAYALQGLAALFVTRLQGEYSNVVGLPLSLLYGLMRESGFDLLGRKWLQGGREP
jgi:septum formation protein